MNAPSTPQADLNGDLETRLCVRSAELDWVASPAGGVERKRFHRVGPPESGQVTSLVRYLPGSRFPEHPHPEGEEILVLDGTFSDHQGDHRAGSWLANPEGFVHAPWSDEGALLFVKLRQYPDGRPQRALQTRDPALAWARGSQGGEVLRLLDESAFPERITLERWPLGGPRALFSSGGVELFVIEGRLSVDGEALGAHDFLRLPPGEPAGVEILEPALVWLARDSLAHVVRNSPLPSD